MKHRDTFFMYNGPEPWPCCFCGVLITYDDLYRQPRMRPVVHHVDGDHDNDDPENLRLAHFTCHTVHHNTGSKRSPEVRKRMRLAAAKRKEVPARIRSARAKRAWKGKSAEERSAIRASRECNPA